MKKKRPAVDESTNYVNLERLTFLVDGVFAITITLLVLELRPPESSAENLAQSLLTMLPRLYIYLIAFYSIANHWVVHQRMFRHITSADTKMLWLTMLGLLFITLIPASTAIMGRYPAEKLAAACFSANSFLQALSTWMFWSYVIKRQKQFASASDPRLLKITSQVWLVIAVGWLVSILLGFVNVYLAYTAWILLPIWSAFGETTGGSTLNDKKKNQTRENADRQVSAFGAMQVRDLSGLLYAPRLVDGCAGSPGNRSGLWESHDAGDRSRTNLWCALSCLQRL